MVIYTPRYAATPCAKLTCGFSSEGLGAGTGATWVDTAASRGGTCAVLRKARGHVQCFARLAVKERQEHCLDPGSTKHILHTGVCGASHGWDKSRRPRVSATGHVN